MVRIVSWCLTLCGCQLLCKVLEVIANLCTYTLALLLLAADNFSPSLPSGWLADDHAALLVIALGTLNGPKESRSPNTQFTRSVMLWLHNP